MDDAGRMGDESARAMTDAVIDEISLQNEMRFRSVIVVMGRDPGPGGDVDHRCDEPPVAIDVDERGFDAAWRGAGDGEGDRREVVDIRGQRRTGYFHRPLLIANRHVAKDRTIAA